MTDRQETPKAKDELVGRPEPLVLSLLADGMSVELAVTGASMSPFIRSQDTVTLTPIDPQRIRRGDIVAFTRAGGQLVVHRVIDLTASRFRTRGDAAPQADEWIARRLLVARVTAVMRHSRPVSFGLRRGSLTIAWLSRAGLLAAALRPLRWLTRRLHSTSSKRSIAAGSGRK